MAGGHSAPLTLLTSYREISADLPGKEREGKKECGEQKGKIKKGRWKIENREKVTK